MRRSAILPLCFAGLVVGHPGPILAQPVLERTPNLAGTYVTPTGTGMFSFTHRFFLFGDKLVNYPTFLLDVGLPWDSVFGGLYGSNAQTVLAGPNDSQVHLKKAVLHQAQHAVDLVVMAAYNGAAISADGELQLARSVGPVRLIGTARGFSNGYGLERSVGGVGVGANWRVLPFVALAGDLFRVVSEHQKLAWGIGLQSAIPYTPHTLALHATNVNTVTAQGASRGTDDVRYGFEFTIHFANAARWKAIFTGQPDEEPAVQAPGATTETNGAKEMQIEIRQQAYHPARLTVRTGTTIIWQNRDDVLHTVTADPAKAQRQADGKVPAGAEPFDSGFIKPGAQFRQKLTVPGSYRYFCIPHEMMGMTGAIEVLP